MYQSVHPLFLSVKNASNNLLFLLSQAQWISRWSQIRSWTLLQFPARVQYWFKMINSHCQKSFDDNIRILHKTAVWWNWSLLEEQNILKCFNSKGFSMHKRVHSVWMFNSKGFSMHKRVHSVWMLKGFVNVLLMFSFFFFYFFLNKTI